MLDTFGRRLCGFVLVTALLAGASSCTAKPAHRAATPSPTSPAADDHSLGALLQNAGVDADFGSDWGAFDMPNGSGRDFGPALILAREKPLGTLWIEIDPANGRSLSRYVRDHAHHLGYTPGAGRAVEICRGTQAAWYVEHTNTHKDGNRKTVWGNIDVLTINRSRGLAVAYGFIPPTAVDAHITTALLTMCLRDNARGF